MFPWACVNNVNNNWLILDVGYELSPRFLEVFANGGCGLVCKKLLDFWGV
jgi:hypothetical protein